MSRRLIKPPGSSASFAGFPQSSDTAHPPVKLAFRLPSKTFPSRQHSSPPAVRLPPRARLPPSKQPARLDLRYLDNFDCLSSLTSLSAQANTTREQGLAHMIWVSQ